MSCYLTNCFSMRKDHGFTLVELMVVLSIIGTIISLGLIQYNDFKHRAYDVEAEGNIRSAIKVIQALDVDDEYANIDFEVSNADILIDTYNFSPHFPKITNNPKGVYLYILKNGKNVNIVSYQCHGTKKYSYDSTVGEYLVTTAKLLQADLDAKCASAL